MSNAIANQVAAALATADGQSIASWASGKKTRTAHTESALNAAPKKVRDEFAHEATYRRIASGRYVGFCRDAVQALTAGHKTALASHIGRALRSETSLPVRIDVDALTNLPAVDKALFRIIAQFLASPRAVAKNVEADKPLSKANAWISTLAARWLAENAPAAVAAPAEAEAEAEAIAA